MAIVEWTKSDTDGQHAFGTARAVNEDDAFCIISFGSDDTDFCIKAIVAATRYADASGPITVAKTNENRVPMVALQESGVVQLGPYLSDTREMVAIVAIDSDQMQ